jgi:WD40 repeat protein
VTEQAPVGTADEIQRMQDGVRDWVHKAARRSQSGLRSASPAILLSLLCASAFCPLLMAPGLAGAGLSVLSGVGGGFLNQVVSDALDRLRKHQDGHPPSQQDLEKGVAQQIQQVLAAGDARAATLRGEIASVLQEIDAGGTALRAVMEQGNERVRGEVIAAIGALGSDFSEMRFLLHDVAQAAAEIQKSLDVQGADLRAIREQNTRQSTDIRLVREDLAVIVRRASDDGSQRAPQGNGSARWEGGCPYRGLLPFGESDSAVFYGRERLVTELAVKVTARVTGGGLVVVTGASGAGKSSLLRAGLLPILARGQQVHGSDRWPRIVMTPTKDPLTELAARLAAVGGPDTLTVRDGLARHPDQAHLAVWSAALASAARQNQESPAADDGAARLVLIVDQFEQVFTLNSGAEAETARQAFVTALCSAATTPVGPAEEPPALVVIAVRGDFWDRCAAFPELVGALQDGQFVVGPMTESELRVAITGPADAAGLRIDPALTDTILGDLRVAGGDRSAGVLPLLSQAMALTWEQREGDRLTSHGYAQSGGVSQAVQTGAERVYGVLQSGQQVLAREVLRSMTVASRDGGLSRRPVTREDLYAGLPDAARSDIDAVLDAFAAERLAVLDDHTAQLSHDVLLRAWPRLRGWLEEDQASWILNGQLADAAAAWHEGHDDPSFLYRGAQLVTLRQAVTQWSANPARYPALTGIQRDFMQASEHAATRSHRRRRRSLIGLGLLTVLALVASGVAFYQRGVADQQRDQANYKQVIAEALQYGATDPSLAAQLLLAAYRIGPTQDLASRLLDTENTPLSSSFAVGAKRVTAVAFGSDGYTLASGNSDSTVGLWDVADPAHPRRLGQLGQPQTSFTANAVVSVALGADGNTLASGYSDGTIRLWDAADPAHRRPIGQVSLPQADSGSVYLDSIAFSPDGNTLASGYSDGTIRLWNVINPAPLQLIGQPLAGDNSGVTSLAFNRAGTVLASAGNDGLIQLWGLADPRHPRLLARSQAANGASAQSVAFSADGDVLASGNGDGTIQLLNVTDPAEPRLIGQPLAGDASTVNSVAFSPSGHTLASGDDDGTIRMWDLTDPADPQLIGQPLAGDGSAVNSVAFSPSGHTLASGDDDGMIRLWTLPPTLLAGSGSVGPVAFRGSGRMLASGYGDGTVQLWDVSNPAHPRPLSRLGQPQANGSDGVGAVAFSPDGNTLASGYGDAVQLWDITHPAHPLPLGQPLSVGDSGVSSVAFSRNGRMLAAGNLNGTIQLWDITAPAHPRTLGQTDSGDGFVDSVAFSPDGRMLVSGYSDSTIWLWGITDPANPQPLHQIGRPQLGSDSVEVDSVAFSPHLDTVASGYDDGAIQLWDISHPARYGLVGQAPTSSSAPVYAAAFSPGGQTLAAGYADGMIQLWDVTDPAHPRQDGQPLTGSSAAVNSVAFSPDGQVLASGDSDDEIRLWDLDVQYPIDRICATIGGLTRQQWGQYVQVLPYQPSCVP